MYTRQQKKKYLEHVTNSTMEELERATGRWIDSAFRFHDQQTPETVAEQLKG